VFRLCSTLNRCEPFPTSCRDRPGRSDASATKADQRPRCYWSGCSGAPDSWDGGTPLTLDTSRAGHTPGS